MKLIELSNSDDHKLFEWGDCRITVSTQRPLHVCLLAIRNGIFSSPNDFEIYYCIDTFFRIEGKLLQTIRDKMFTQHALHIWEKTPLTEKLVSK